MVYKKRFFEYNKSERKLTELSRIYEDILDRLEKACEEGDLDEYTIGTILAMSRKVIEHVTAKYNKVKERLGDIMGGTVLDHPVKTAYRNGVQYGESKGRSKGKIEGKIEMCISLLKDGVISMAEAAKRLDMEEDEVVQYLQ